MIRFKKYLSHSVTQNIVTTIIAMIISSCLLLAGKSLVGTFLGINEDFYMKYFYDAYNYEGAEKENVTTPDSLTIINIQNYRNRQDIANILDKVYELGPKVICLDLFFGNNPDIKEDVNDKLITVLKKVKDKTVIPCYYETNESGVVSTIYPFFSKEKGLDDIIYASPVAQGYFTPYRFYDTYIVNKDPKCDSLPRLSYQIARLSHTEIHSEEEVIYVNYLRKDLDKAIISDTTKIRASEINNHVVLIGDLSDIKDIVRLPFRFGDKIEISGIEDIAYSFISLKQDNRNRFDDPKRFIAFQDLNLGASIFISFVLTFVFCFLFKNLNRVKCKAKEKKWYYAIPAILFLPLMIIIGEIVVVVVLFKYTCWTNMIPDLFLSMISIALIGTSVDITNIIYKNK